MRIGGACGVVFAAALVTLGALPGREHAICQSAPAAGEPLEALEAHVASEPGDLAARTALAHAYLDRDAPGLAIGALDSAPESQRQQPALEHMKARVYIEQGLAKEALAMERSVLSTCGSESSPAADAKGCDFWLIVSANRRAAILQELVKDGVEDAVAEPEASLVAYHKATHETRLAVAQ